MKPRVTKYVCSFNWWASTKSAQIIALGSNLVLPWGSSFIWTYKGKTLEISLYLAIKLRATKFYMLQALSIGSSPRGVNYSHKVKLIAKGH